MKVRLIVKEIYQPPIDTPASIQWQTVEVESEELYKLIHNNTRPYRERDFKHSTFEVIGAEPLNVEDNQ